MGAVRELAPCAMVVAGRCVSRLPQVLSAALAGGLIGLL
jgi:hypothetical protein